MATTPRIRTRNTALLGGAGVSVRDNGQVAASIARAGQSLSQGIQAQASARDQIERDRAAQYVAEQAPTIELGMTELLEEQKQLASSESIDEFTTIYRESVDSQIDEAVENAPPLAQDRMRARLAQAAARNAGKALRFEAQEAARFQAESFEKGAQAIGAQLVSDPSMLGEKLQQQFEEIEELSAPDSAKARYKARTGELLGVAAVEGLIGGPNADPASALERIEGGEFDDLVGPGDKATLMRRAQTAIRAEQANARGELTALKAAVRDEVSFLAEATRDGVRAETSPEDVLGMIEDNGLAGDMPQEVQELRLLASVQGDTQTFRRDGTVSGLKTAEGKPIRRPEGEPVLRMMDATRDALVAQDRQARTRKSHLMVQSANAMIDQVEDRMENDPMLGLVEAGVIEQRSKIDVEKPDAWQDMMGAVEEARGYYGRDVTPYSSDQIGAMREFLNTQAPDAQAGYLEGMVQGMPDEMADSVARQVSGQDDPSLAVAIGMAARGRGLLTSQILMGRETMRGETFNLSDRDFNDALDDLPSVVEALGESPQALNEFTAAAKALYVAMTPAGEMVGSDVEVDADRFEKAFDALMGGPVLSLNGRALPPPVEGMTQDQFDQAMERIEPGDFTRFGRVKPPGQPFAEVGDAGLASAPGSGTPGADPQILTPDDFRRAATLVPAADGIYYVRFGDTPLLGRDGLPYAFDLGAFLRDPETSMRETAPPRPTSVRTAAEARTQPGG